MRYFSFLLFFITLSGFSQGSGFQAEELRITPLIDGTLLLPDPGKKIPLAIIIAGSGPTDRDGNQPMMVNNSLKFLAEGLYKKGIASFRYDKRIVKLQRRMGFIDEEKIRFDDFIEDAVAVLSYFKNDSRFSGIYIIGHSQGSLIGMLAAQEGASGFISIAGAGQEIDDVVVDQLQQQAPALADDARISFDDMRANGIAADFNPGLASIFRMEIQPFMLNWMEYNPQTEIAKLNIPVFIIQGNNDFQVLISEGELLKEAKPDAEYLVIENMNHILKEVKSKDNLENSKTYNRHNLPVMPALLKAVSDFILQSDAERK